MIKSAFHRSKRILSAVLWAGMICFASCSIDKTDDMPMPDDNRESSDYVRISARVHAAIASRAYQESGEVKSGDFVLTYPFSVGRELGDTVYTYQQADVHFGTTDLENLGFATYWDPKKGQQVDLKWSDVQLRALPSGGRQSAVFYLDNVPLDLHDAQSSIKIDNSHGNLVFFNYDEGNGETLINPFQAGPFDFNGGTNDLLWGRQDFAYKNSKKVDFVLHHNMSRVRVKIDAKERDDNTEAVDLSRVVKLELCGLHHEPLYYDRTNGNLTLKDEPETANVLTLVDFDEDNQSVSDPISWKEIAQEDVDNEGRKFTRYTSIDFVVPPQDLVNDSDRPFLRLTIPAKYAKIAGMEDDKPVVYEAALPQNMYYTSDESEEGDTNLPPMPLSFMKEHILNIRAVVGPPDLKLQFAPVQVQDWTDLGSHQIEGNQAGIYNNQDFYNFLESYAGRDTVRLERYGYKNGFVEDSEGKTHSKWVFMFWTSNIKLSLNGTDKETGIYHYLADCFNDPEDAKYYFEKVVPFTFSFNNNVVHTDDPIYPDLTGAAGQIRLYNWLTDGQVDYPGIRDADHFMQMIGHYNSRKPSTSALTEYGAYDNADEQWILEFTEGANGQPGEEVVLEYGTIAKQMKFFEGVGNFAFNFRGRTVRITGIPGFEDPDGFVLEGTEGEQILHAILSYPSGIYSTEDVALLIRSYNSLDKSDDVEEEEPNGGSNDAAVDLSWLLTHFEKDNTSPQTFQFIKSVEIDGPDIYASMVPDAAKNLPAYEFARYTTGGNSPTVKVADTGTYVYSYTDMSLIKKLFAAGGVIASDGNLGSMISYANNGNPIYRRFYGWHDESDPKQPKWIYPITSSFSIDYTERFGKLTSYEPTEIQLMGDCKVTVTGMPNGAPDLLCRGQQGAEILLKILYGTYKPDDYEPGIETSSDFADLFTAYGSNDVVALQRYGTKAENEDKWIFKFTETAENPIRISYNAVYAQMKQTATSAGEFAFDLGDHTVVVTGLGSNPDELSLQGAAGATLLHAILTDPESLATPEDVALLIEAYNGTMSLSSLSLGQFGSPMMNGFSSIMRTTAPLAAVTGNFEWILDLYGSKNGGQWNFPFAGSMTLEGPQIYGSMKPDGNSGKLDYRFSRLSDEVGITVHHDDNFTRPVGIDKLKILFAASGAVTNAADLTGLAETGRENPIVWRFYGQTIGSTWTFPITGSFEVSYDAVWQKLGTDDASKFAFDMSDEVTVKLTGLPTNYRKIECSGATGAETLRDILCGLYTNPEPAIRDNAELEALITAYNDPTKREDLPTYGAEANSVWTFWIRAALTPTIDQIYGRMKPATNGTPAYVFQYDANGSVRIDGTSVDADHLKILLAANGEVKSDADLRALTDTNPITRRYYGRLNGETWEFPVNASFSVAYNAIFKQVAVTDRIAFVMKSGVTVTVTDLPGQRQLSCTGDAGARTLVEILQGSYTPVPGIELPADIPQLTAAYNSHGEATMKIYGELSGGAWTFTFRKTMQLTGDAVYGKMDPAANGNAPYEFAYDTNVQVTVDGTQVNTAQLKILFAAAGEVKSEADLLAVKNANAVVRRYYGNLNGSQWEFPIKTSFDADYNKIKNQFGTNEIISQIAGGVKVTVKNLPGSRTVECEGATGAETLTNILQGTYTPESGILKKEDIEGLIAAYGTDDATELGAYGTQSGDRWTFIFRTGMELDGSIFGSMKPGSGKPEYDFDLSGGTITVRDGDATATPNAVQLKTLFAGTGAVTSAEELLAVKEADAIVRRYYGNLNGSQWEFPITVSFKVKYDQLVGQLTATDVTFRLENGVAVTVTDQTDDSTIVVCEGNEGAETLSKILRGEYTRPTPDPDPDPDPDGGNTGGSDPQP